MPKNTTKAPPDDDAPPDGGAADTLENLDYETAYAELESLLDRMEAGEMTLQASLSAYERGVKLARHCQAALRQADLKVMKLTEDNLLEDLDPDAFDDD